MSIEKPQGHYTVSAIICSLDEEQGLPSVLPKIPMWVDEVILVDAHSKDKTVEVALQLRPDIKVLYQPGKGKGDAMQYGIEQAFGDIVVLLDADGQNNPEDIGEFIAPLLNGADFAKGSRLTKGRPTDMPFHRWIGNCLIAISCNILFRTKFTDLCSGYNAFWRQTLLSINPWTNENWGYEPLLIARVIKHRLKVSEVPHIYIKRANGKSKLPDFKQGLTAIKVLFRERFNGR